MGFKLVKDRGEWAAVDLAGYHHWSTLGAALKTVLMWGFREKVLEALKDLSKESGALHCQQENRPYEAKSAEIAARKEQ